MVLKETIRSIGWGGPPLSLSHTHTQTHTCTVHGLVPTFCHPYEITEVFTFVEGLEQNLSFGGKVDLPAETGQSLANGSNGSIKTRKEMPCKLWGAMSVSLHQNPSTAFCTRCVSSLYCMVIYVQSTQG